MWGQTERNSSSARHVLFAKESSHRVVSWLTAASWGSWSDFRKWAGQTFRDSWASAAVYSGQFFDPGAARDLRAGSPGIPLEPGLGFCSMRQHRLREWGGREDTLGSLQDTETVPLSAVWSCRSVLSSQECGEQWAHCLSGAPSPPLPCTHRHTHTHTCHWAARMAPLKAERTQ
jgi:hypothetical protein